MLTILYLLIALEVAGALRLVQLYAPHTPDDDTLNDVKQRFKLKL